MTLNPGFSLAAAALLLAGAGGAALAHPHPDGDGDGKQVKRIIVIEDSANGAHEFKGKQVQRFRIVRDGEGHADAEMRHFEIRDGGLVDCGGGEKIVDESTEDGAKKTKVIICSKGPPAASAEQLEKALARIKADSELNADQKARIETALRSAIDRAQSAR
ncbi:MAG: hypothetical protein QOJ91_2885 [Sphingomonadales bacterium]|jgi:hypothetical protein|nr:hypothetical protein [Sphingomonadales bacterium]